MADDAQAEAPPRQRSLAHDARLIVATILVALLVVFAVDNRRETRVEYLVGHRDAPLWVLLAATALVGALIGALVTRRRAHKH